MAVYVAIEKTSEDASVATYRFKGDWGLTGVFQINKEDGKVTLVEQMPGDEKGHLFAGASFKIFTAWREGSLPQFAELAC